MAYLLRHTPPARPGFFARLARDASGNTMALVAASIAPILAMVGGGVDMGRSYLAESRLQQACDAGVLAARKKLGSAAVVTGEVPGEVQAIGERFFNINFRAGAYGTRNRDFAMTLEDDYSISGAASVDVPTTIMGIFGFENVAVATECQARLNFSNTDVMMVLDTTGSMAQINSGDSVSRIAALQSTIVSFTSQLLAGRRGDSRVRFGFVPYSTNVNVGHLLKSDWVVDAWDYQSRASAGGSGRWIYRPIRHDVSFLKSGETLGNGAITAAFAGVALAPLPGVAPFNGCIEERATYEITDYDNVDLDRALDLDIDRVPDPSNPDTQWKPQFPALIYDRALRWDGSGAFSSANTTTSNEYVAPGTAGFAGCPPAARQLDEMSLAEITAFVGTLTPRGSTYHDIGMIWGGRLLSPTGIFAEDNADEAPGKPTSRNLIFLTDGQTAPLDVSYTSYGVEPIDKRRWTPASTLSLREMVEARFAFACKEVRKKNITIWVIAFGTELNPVMTECAGPGHAFEASDADSLSRAFDDIARSIGDLRIAR